MLLFLGEQPLFHRNATSVRFLPGPEQQFLDPFKPRIQLVDQLLLKCVLLFQLSNLTNSQRGGVPNLRECEVQNLNVVIETQRRRLAGFLLCCHVCLRFRDGCLMLLNATKTSKPAIFYENPSCGSGGLLVEIATPYSRSRKSVSSFNETDSSSSGCCLA